MSAAGEAKARRARLRARVRPRSFVSLTRPRKQGASKLARRANARAGNSTGANLHWCGGGYERDARTATGRAQAAVNARHVKAGSPS